MSVTYGFYNANLVNGTPDRVYDAMQVSSIFDGIISDGVFNSFGNKLAVSANTGMNVSVGTGRAWFNHTWTYNDAALILSISAADSALDRIDCVILEVNTSTRTNSIKIKKGTAASSPVAPSMTKSGGVYQYPLANVRVNHGVTSITSSNITNRRGTTACPFAAALQPSITIDELIASFESQFDTLLAQLRTQIQQATDIQLVDHAVSRIKLANDALYSPVTDINASSYVFTINDLGKTFRVIYNGDVNLSFTSGLYTAAYAGFEVAVVKWVSNDTTKIYFSTDSNHYLAIPGKNGRPGKISLSERYGMMALKLCTQTSVLASGNVDWEDTV